MSIFQYVRAQLGDSLLERICRRHCENKQTFFELLQTMTGVKIIPQFEDGGYVIEGSWEAMERSVKKFLFLPLKFLLLNSQTWFLLG